MEDLSNYTETLIPYLIDHGLSLIGAVLILILGWFAANWAKKRVVLATNKSEKFDNTLTPVFGQTVKVTILIVTLLTVLAQFGIETTSLIAVLGAAGLAVGLALQGTLSNVASGVMLLILRPFKVGDVVDIGGTMGVVDEIGLFTTEMHSFDNVGIILPNSRVWGNNIENYTKFEIRRVDMEVGISYNDDMEKAMGLIREVLSEDDRVLPEPEPLVAVSTLGDSSVTIRVRPWTETENVWPLRYSITQKIKEKFDENEISIPFPQRDIHLFQDK